jgi:N-carbamoylputrescine amidase
VGFAGTNGTEAARLTALRGAEILFYPTAIGWHPSEKKEFGAAQYSAWETIQRSHAIANGCFVAAANRVGHEAPTGGDGIEFWGQSFICGPDGEIIAKGSVDREEIVTADVEWDRVNEHRTHWPSLRDRRVDAYATRKNDRLAMDYDDPLEIRHAAQERSLRGIKVESDAG